MNFDIPEEFTDEEKDHLLRALAARSSPNNCLEPINFRIFANTAYTIQGEGERPFGERGTAERQRCRRQYDVYLKQARRGATDLVIPLDWSYWSVLQRTDDLVLLLNPIGSLSSSSLHSNRNRSLSPKRSTNTHCKSLSPKRRTTTPCKTPNMATGKDDSTYSAVYQRLLDDQNSHAVDFNRAFNNNGIVAYERNGVNVERGTYATKIGILFPVTTPAQIVHAYPTIANGGKVIRVMEPSHHPMLNGTYPGSGELLDACLDRSLGKDDERNAAVDRTLGVLHGDGIVKHDLLIGGVTIVGVSFQPHSYHLPPNMSASNKFFNPESSKLDDVGLDTKVLVITDLHMKNPMDIIDGLRDKAPTVTAVTGETDVDAKLALYGVASKAFLEAQTSVVNTAVYLSVEFTVNGEVDKGSKAEKAPSVVDLFSGFKLG